MPIRGSAKTGESNPHHDETDNSSGAVTLCIILIPSFRSHSLSLAQGVDINTLGVGSALWAEPVKPGVVPAGAGNGE